jgi:hypothetical protein
MVFDIKMEDFRCKARLVAVGHKTDVPATITYASLVLCETVRIALTLAALNDIEVKVGDMRKYGQYSDLNLEKTPERVPSLCRLFMDTRVQVLHSAHTSHLACKTWDTSHAKQTLTYG